jgi:hypothetical protein
MDPNLAFNFLLWAWIAIGVGCFGLLVYALFDNGVPDDTEDTVSLNLVLMAGTGCLAAPLMLMGQGAIGLWVLRIGCGLGVVGALLTFQKYSYRTATRLAAIGVIVVNAIVASATGFMSTPAQAAQIPTLQLPTFSISVIAFSGVTLWHGIALTLLALGTVAFLCLFVRMIETGDSPQLESHWGGIGGGLGGWRMSGSLTYLAAATVFGVLFAFFVLQLDSATDAGTRTGTSTQATQTPGT